MPDPFREEDKQASVTSKKLPNVYKICSKMISLEKLKILTPLQKLPKNIKPEVQQIAQSGHTGRSRPGLVVKSGEL